MRRPPLLNIRLRTIFFQVKIGSPILAVLKTLQQSTTLLTSTSSTPIGPSQTSLQMVRDHHTFKVRAGARCLDAWMQLYTVLARVDSTCHVRRREMHGRGLGYDFVWRAGKDPYFQKPDGAKIKFV